MENSQTNYESISLDAVEYLLSITRNQMMKSYNCDNNNYELVKIGVSRTIDRFRENLDCYLTASNETKDSINKKEIYE